MNPIHKRVHITLSTLLLTLLCTEVAIANQAVGKTPAQLREKIQSTARQVGMPTYTRTCPNGAKRIIMNVVGHNQLQGVKQVFNNQSDVLEICHVGSSTANHTLGIFKRDRIHAQYANGTSNWRLGRWATNGLEAGRGKLYSAAIQLTRPEAKRLDEQLKHGFQAQGPANQAGARWENGNLGRAYNRSLNCVSVFSEMPIGAHGEPLWKVVGLPRSFSGNPRGLMQALETQANDRVAGICIYGPQLQGFGANPNQNQFTF